MIFALTAALLALDLGASAPPAAVEPEDGRVGTIEIGFDPPGPVKGKVARVAVRIAVKGPDGAPLATPSPPSLFASTGRVGPVAPGAGPGIFEATWEPSDTPQPEVLGLLALAPRCPLCPTPLALGAARLPVAAAIDLPGRTDPGVLTRVELGGKVWGPVRADAEGRFALPVVVPPGARWGVATSLSSLGNERRTKLDLRLSEAPGLQCAAWPQRVPGDGRQEAGIFCIGWNATGGELEIAGLRSAARSGEIAVEPPSGRIWRGRWRPGASAAASDRISLEVPGAAPARAGLEVGIAPGAPASIEWRIEGEPLPPGAVARVEARAVDARGVPLGDAAVDGRLLADGRLQLRGELGDGVQRVKLSWSAPAGAEPVRLYLVRDGAQWLAAARDVAERPVAGVPLVFGSGAREATDLRGEARVAAKGDQETVEGPAGLRAAARAGEGRAPPPTSVEREVRIALRPPGTVDVDATVDGRWIRWRVRGGDGSLLPGRAVKVSSETVELGPAEPLEGGGRSAVRRGTGIVAVQDVATGAVTLVEVR